MSQYFAAMLCVLFAKGSAQGDNKGPMDKTNCTWWVCDTPGETTTTRPTDINVGGGYAGATSDMYEAALAYLGSSCDAITSSGCNLFQLPMYSGASFVPSKLAGVTKAQVWIEPTQRIQQDSSVSKEDTISRVSSTHASDFGIDISVPLQEITFSAGVQHQDLVSNMHSSTDKIWYAEVSREFTVFTATINDTVGLAEAVMADAKLLPDSCNTTTDEDQWMAFFSKYGTHYVRSVTFGGKMQMYTFVQNSVTADTGVSSSEWDVNLGVQFAQLAGIGANFSDSTSQDTFHSFSSYTFNQQFYSLGGDQTVSGNYDAWLASVPNAPAPYFTTLGSLKDLLEPNKDFDTAFFTYLTRCPYTDDGICNGLGGCDVDKRHCNCRTGTYQEDDGNCYAECEDDCNGHGTCQYGTCVCDVDSYGIGFTGSSCDTKCGSFFYSVSDGSCIRKEGGGCIDFCTSEGCGSNGESLGATCFCQYLVGKSDEDLVSVSYSTAAMGITYECDTGRQQCWGAWACGGLVSFTCQYGSVAKCPGADQHRRLNVLTHPILKAIPIPTSAANSSRTTLNQVLGNVTKRRLRQSPGC
eukprot:INCI14148.1.p1 GENE.INCI14148.1~~INCI14148.1.p1  ORF type:complete len:580 (-),score=55.90 INCI14148.1:258-1997(-)